MTYPVDKQARSRHSRRGSVILEFAVGAGVMMAIFAGTFRFGYNFFRYNKLATAVSNGAHYAALRVYDSNTSTPSNAYLTAVQNMVVYGDPTGTATTPAAPGLTPSNVSVLVKFSSTVAGKGVPLTVTVYISHYTFDAVFAQTTYDSKPSVTYDYQGVYAPY